MITDENDERPGNYVCDWCDKYVQRFAPKPPERPFRYVDPVRLPDVDLCQNCFDYHVDMLNKLDEEKRDRKKHGLLQKTEKKPMVEHATP